MSCGVDFTHNAQIHQLKSMVQNIIIEHELISTGKAIFNVFEDFQENFKQCPACESNLSQAKQILQKIFTEVSTQMIELGHFTLSILQTLGRSNECSQELKETVKKLQIKNSQLIQCLSEIQLQNQQMKLKVQDLQEIMKKTDEQIVEIQLVNHQLNMNKIILENNILAIQSQINKQKKSEINVLQQELSDLRQKHLMMTNEKQKLQKQVTCLNQELKTYSYRPSQCSLKIQSRSQSFKRSPLINEGQNQLGDKSFEKNPVEEFNMSPALIQTKSSLEQDMGSEKAFNFCLYSPSISRVSIADCLSNQSLTNTADLKIQKNKQNSNTINKCQQLGATGKLKKKENVMIKKASSVEMQDKEVQTNFILQLFNVQSSTILENQIKVSIGSDLQEKNKEFRKVEFAFEREFVQKKTTPSQDKTIISKFIEYLSKVCITDRIKSKNTFYF